MKYCLKVYKSKEDFENRIYERINEGYDSMEAALIDARRALEGKLGSITYQSAKVESDDQEEIEIRVGIKKDRFKLTWDGYALDIYIENGEDKDPTTVVYWVDDEWEEDPETVVPAMVTAMELFYTDPEKIFEKLNLPYLLVD